MGTCRTSMLPMCAKLQTNHESTTGANKLPISLTQTSPTNVEEIREMLTTGMKEPEKGDADTTDHQKLFLAFVDVPKKVSNSIRFHREVDKEEKQLSTSSHGTEISDTKPKRSQKFNEEITEKRKQRHSKLPLPTHRVGPKEQSTQPQSEKMTKTARDKRTKNQTPTEESPQKLTPGTIQIAPAKPAPMLHESEKQIQDKNGDQSHFVPDNAAADGGEIPQKIPAELAKNFSQVLPAHLQQASNHDVPKETLLNVAIEGPQELKTELASETKFLEDGGTETKNDIDTFQEEHPAEANYDETELESHSVEVSGVNKETSQETLKMFFQNRRKSGGGKIDHIWCDEDTGNFVITFENRDGRPILCI